jgi:outer membrane biosynthesis protein TonB
MYDNVIKEVNTLIQDKLGADKTAETAKINFNSSSDGYVDFLLDSVAHRVSFSVKGDDIIIEKEFTPIIAEQPEATDTEEKTSDEDVSSKEEVGEEETPNSQTQETVEDQTETAPIQQETTEAKPEETVTVTTEKVTVPKTDEEEAPTENIEEVKSEATEETIDTVATKPEPYYGDFVDMLSQDNNLII